MQIRLTLEQEAQFARLAKQGGRSAEDFVQEALTEWIVEVSYKDEIRHKIAEGLLSQRHGDLVDGEAVMARIEAELDALED